MATGGSGNPLGLLIAYTAEDLLAESRRKN